MTPCLILIVYSDFEDLPKLLVIERNERTRFILSADGCIVNVNNSKYEPEITEWITSIDESEMTVFNPVKHGQYVDHVINVGFV